MILPRLERRRKGSRGGGREGKGRRERMYPHTFWPSSPPMKG